MKKLIIQKNPEKGVWTHISTNAMLLAGIAQSFAMAVQQGWLLLDADMRATLNPTLVRWVAIGLLVLGFLGKFVEVKLVKGDADDDMAE